MAEHSSEAVQKEVRTYIAVFVTLAVMTALTVGVSYLHLPLLLAITVALLIASVKSSLVAGFFMHLFSEKRIIWWVLALAVFFFLHLLLVPSWHLY